MSTGLRFAVIVTAIVASFTAMMHAPILLRPPTNTDELIYLRLALSMKEGTGYTLQGSRILSSLPAEMYDHPVFNHPPGFPGLLVPMVAAGLARWAVLISLLAHLATAAAVAFVGYRLLLREDDSLWRRMLFCLVGLAAFLDPILSFCSRRVWMDNVLAAWIAWAFVGVFLLRSSKPLAALLLASACMAAAVGTKLLMLVFLPPMALAVFLLYPGTAGIPLPPSDQPNRRPSTPTNKTHLRNLLIFVLPSLMVFAIWEAIFFQSTGQWFPKWLSIPSEVLANKEFMALRQDEPFLFFPAKLLMLSPLAALVLTAGLYLIAKYPPHREPPLAHSEQQNANALWNWFTGASQASPRPVLIFSLLAVAVYLISLLLLGHFGFSKEARYLTPIAPAIGMALAGVFGVLAKDGGHSHSLKSQIFVFACLLAIVSSAMLAGFYLFAIQFDEPLSWWGLIDSAMENL